MTEHREKKFSYILIDMLKKVIVSIFKLLYEDDVRFFGNQNKEI